MTPVPLALRAAAFVAVFPGTVVGVAPALLLQWTRGTPLPPPVQGAVPLALAGAGALFLAGSAALFVGCLADFMKRGHGTPAPWDAPRRLVTSGPYTFSRNPMYVAILTWLAGEALVWRAPALAVYAAIVFVVFHARVVRFEEPRLAQTFGAEYAKYRKTTPRWIGRRRITGSGAGSSAPRSRSD